MAEIIEMATKNENENPEVIMTVSEAIAVAGTDTFSLLDLPEDKLEELWASNEIDEDAKPFVEALTLQLIDAGDPVLVWREDGSVSLDVTIRIRSIINPELVDKIAAKQQPEEEPEE